MFEYCGFKDSSDDEDETNKLIGTELQENVTEDKMLKNKLLEMKEMALAAFGPGHAMNKDQYAKHLEKMESYEDMTDAQKQQMEKDLKEAISKAEEQEEKTLEDQMQKMRELQYQLLEEKKQREMLERQKQQETEQKQKLQEDYQKLLEQNAMLADNYKTIETDKSVK